MSELSPTTRRRFLETLLAAGGVVLAGGLGVGCSPGRGRENLSQWIGVTEQGVAIGRAYLEANPSEGEAARLADTVADINRQGLTVVMIEHNLGEVLRVSLRLVVLDNGRTIADGKPVDVLHDPRVRAAEVGKERQNAAA